MPKKRPTSAAHGVPSRGLQHAWVTTTRRPELNFTHLRSFRAVAIEGRIAAAARRLGLSQPTVSEQVASLERTFGRPLVERRGALFVLTEAGRAVLAHAEEVFAAADRLVDALDGETLPTPKVVVGVVESMPKRIAWKLLEPALRSSDAVQLECCESDLETHLARLATHQLDVILSDAPVPPGAAVHAFNHLLGESAVTWFARSGVVPEGEWPRRLDRAPILLPVHGPLSRRLEDWIERADVRPRIVARFQDQALLKTAGGHGAGAFAAPSVLAQTLVEEFALEELGPCDGVGERYYAISSERRIVHPAVVAICRGARDHLDTGSRTSGGRQRGST